MDTDEFYSSFLKIELVDCLKDKGTTNAISRAISKFECKVNSDFEKFIRDKAIEYEKRNISRTSLFTTKDGEVVAYFTISLKTIDLSNLSRKKRELITCGFPNKEYINNSYPCYLLGQLGKSTILQEKKIGDILLNEAINKIKNIQTLAGGNIVMLDSVNEQKVIDFYTRNCFEEIRIDDKTTDNKDCVKMIRNLKTQSYS